MRIAVFGATGIVGRAIVREALAKGYEVTALTRDAAKIKYSTDKLTVVEGNVMERKAVDKTLEGVDAVIQCLGIGGKGDGRPTTFVSDANGLIMEEMARMGVRRLIAISVIGAGDSLYFLPWIYRKMVLPLAMKWFRAIIDDKNRMEPMIERSGLDWTIVRCTTVKDAPSKGRVTALLDGKGLKFSIAAADMARFVVAQLTDNTYLSKTPVISN